MFVQLDELQSTGEEQEWKETARWIKYEEDVNEGTDRWGRPHVASLSFHSLLNVRRSLESGMFVIVSAVADLIRGSENHLTLVIFYYSCGYY